MSKILLITPKFYPSIWGIEEQVKLLGEEFLRLGYQVDILTYRKGRQKKQENIFWMNVFTFWWFISFVNFFLKHRQYKLILSRQYFRHSFFLWILKFLNLVKTKTIICADSGWEKDEITIAKNQSWYLYKFYFFFIGQNNYFNCLNNDNKKHLQNIYKWQTKFLNKIINIYNWIKVPKSNYKNKKIKKIKNLLFLWRFELEKGIFETIEAFKNIKNKNIKLHLVWYWEEQIEQEMQNLINNDGRIVFHWKKYWKEKEEIIDQTDLFLFPTYYPEGQPITLTEMAIKNIPIITTDIANTRNIYWNHVIYTQPQNIKNLQERIKRTIQNIDNFHYDYSQALKKINIQNIVQKFLNL